MDHLHKKRDFNAIARKSSGGVKTAETRDHKLQKSGVKTVYPLAETSMRLQ